MSSSSLSDPFEISSSHPSYDEAASTASPGLAQRFPALSPAPTYAGIVLALVGFGMITYAWGKIAAIHDNVALQMPYLVSGGLAGLGLVMVGVTTVIIAAKRRDVLLRQQQTQLLADALHELRHVGQPH